MRLRANRSQYGARPKFATQKMVSEHKSLAPTIRVNRKGGEQYDEVKLKFEDSTLERD